MNNFSDSIESTPKDWIDDNLYLMQSNDTIKPECITYHNLSKDRIRITLRGEDKEEELVPA